jgi:hypothetical protein
MCLELVTSHVIQEALALLPTGFCTVAELISKPDPWFTLSSETYRFGKTFVSPFTPITDAKFLLTVVAFIK